MTIIVDGSQAKVHWLTNENNSGRLTKDQAVLYEVEKLGQVTRDSAEGLTPAEAFEERYAGKTNLKQDLIARDIFVIDKAQGPNFDYDDGFRAFLHDLYKKNIIPFDALYPGYQLPNSDREALISYNRETHLNILLNCLKQYLGLGLFFDTKNPIVWRFKQEEDAEEILTRLKQHNLCLYAAYTSRGKTKISIEVAVRLYQQGGIVLVTTPITDTKKSFEENVNDFHFGNDRRLKVTYMNSIEFAKHSVTELRQRADNGELIFIVLTVQDARYKDAISDDVEALRDKYDSLSGLVDLWIRDERHVQYSGEVTSKRLAKMKANYELDLTATPYNVLDKYNWEHIVSRSLLWGLKYKQYTNLPTIRIDAVSTPLSNVSPKIAAIYSEEEGFHPHKLFVRSNGNFVFESELKDIRDLMYHSPLSKNKNYLSIANDTELSVVAKNCGFWVLPEGQDGDGAADYIPALADLLNINSKTFFIDSYTLEKTCPKNKTIGDYIESLVAQYGRVIILTCGKFLTGTDIPGLGHIVLMAKMSNIANFEQLLGRMIREYVGKDKVKMYCFAPAMEIGLIQGKMAKLNTLLSGGSEYEMLECIPLTEYTATGPRKISPDAILTEVKEYFKSLNKDRLPSAQLESALSGVDLSVWEKLDTKKFKKSALKTKLTDDNGAKVKIKIDPKTGKPFSKEEINKLEQIAIAIQTIMVEAKWIAYSINNYEYSAVLRNPVLAKMFPEEIDAVIETIESDNYLKEMIIKNLKDKELAYKGLEPIEVYDDIFINNEYKVNMGLVFVTFETAKFLVDTITDHKYINEETTIVVENALSGTIPLLLKNKFPKATIICVEEFDFFKEHLNRLGFKTYNRMEFKNMKIEQDYTIGNPPYNRSIKIENSPLNAGYIYCQITLDMLKKLKPDGELKFVLPSNWLTLMKFKKFRQHLQTNFAITRLDILENLQSQKYFKVGTDVCVLTIKKTTPTTKTIYSYDFGPTWTVDLTSYDLWPLFTSEDDTILYNELMNDPARKTLTMCSPVQIINNSKGYVTGNVVGFIKGKNCATNWKLNSRLNIRSEHSLNNQWACEFSSKEEAQNYMDYAKTNEFTRLTSMIVPGFKLQPYLLAHLGYR
jgi:superfamily II DNA or RNA helicase